MTQADKISHVEIRPMFDFGDHCVVSSFEDAEYFGVYFASVGSPTQRDEIFDDFDEAMQHMLINPVYSVTRKWYNGNEIMSEIYKKEDVFLLLAQYRETREDLIDLGEQLGFTGEMLSSLVNAQTEGIGL